MTAGISDRATALLALPPAPLASSNPTMAPAAVAAVLDALDRGETHYTDRPGILPMREKVAEILNRRFALGCGAGDVVLTCGATEARFVSVQQLLKPGDKLAAPSCADRNRGRRDRSRCADQRGHVSDEARLCARLCWPTSHRRLAQGCSRVPASSSTRLTCRRCRFTPTRSRASANAS